MRQDQLELQKKVNEALEVELKNAKARYGDKFESFNDFMVAFNSEKNEFNKEFNDYCDTLNGWAINRDYIDSKEQAKELKEIIIKMVSEAIQMACTCEKWLEGEGCQS